MNNMDLDKYIASIPDFPSKGILFRDVTPLFQDGEAFRYACDKIEEFAKSVGAEVIAGPEARGFILGSPVAYNMGIGFIPIRKPGKLPRETVSAAYDLEYGTNELHMNNDAIKKGQKVLLVDDLLATGGTVDAAAKIVEELGGEVVGCAFIIELVDLKGREKLGKYEVLSLIEYSGE